MTAIDAGTARRELQVVSSVADAARIFDARAAVDKARKLLTPEFAATVEYPASALGVLAPACQAIAAEGQVREAMAGQCLLAAASLLTQALWNVETLAGPKPLSIYGLTLGDSAEGKSTAQDVALRAVNEWQRAAGIEYSAEVKKYEQYKASRKKGAEPVEMPSSPFRLVGDATVEGLRRDLDTGSSSQGVFTDEAAAILAGYGMSQDHRAKTAGVFSKLWDAGHLSVSRVTGGRTERYGCRVSLHWLVQPMAAAEAISDPLLSQLGFWPRFLLAWPAPMEPRLARPFHPERNAAVGAYWRRCKELLEQELPDDASQSPVIRLSDDALALIKPVFERFEVQARAGELRSVKPFALRATEQLCRVAGVLAAFDKRTVVTREDAVGALQLVTHSIESWKGVIEQGTADPTPANALRLYEWLMGQPGMSTDLSDILKRATPHALRSRDVRDAALDLLLVHQLIERAGRDISIVVGG